MRINQCHGKKKYLTSTTSPLPTWLVLAGEGVVVVVPVSPSRVQHEARADQHLEDLVDLVLTHAPAVEGPREANQQGVLQPFPQHAVHALAVPLLQLLP